MRIQPISVANNYTNFQSQNKKDLDALISAKEILEKMLSDRPKINIANHVDMDRVTHEKSNIEKYAKAIVDGTTDKPEMKILSKEFNQLNSTDKSIAIIIAQSLKTLSDTKISQKIINKAMNKIDTHFENKYIKMYADAIVNGTSKNPKMQIYKMSFDDLDKTTQLYQIGLAKIRKFIQESKQIMNPNQINKIFNDFNKNFNKKHKI